MNKKVLSIVVTTIMVLSFLMAIPASATPPPVPPEPEVLWTYPTERDVADIAVGDLNGDGKDDVVAIENALVTLTAISGDDGTRLWKDELIRGYAVAVGDINGDGVNEVVAGGYNGTVQVLQAYDNEGNIIWTYPTGSPVYDIEIGDIDGDGVDDVVACDPYTNSKIYALDGDGNALPGLWPVTLDGWVVDLAVGQLDGADGMDVAAIGEEGDSCLFAYNSTGDLMWWEPNVGRRAVEIGDVDGDGDNEVVAADYGTAPGFEGFGGVDLGSGVLAFDGKGDGSGNSKLLYSFYTENDEYITDIELGDLDGEPGVEVAAITAPINTTLFAIDIDDDPADQEMWHYNISWHTDYYGESLAIGDVDRDYKNEVVAASESYADRIGETADSALLGYSPGESYVYAFDGLDSDGDGEGDLVWSPYCVGAPITDVELGDIDGDGDQDVGCGTAAALITGVEVGDIDGDYNADVAFGTVAARTVYALTKVENTAQTATGSGTVYLDSDPSTLENLTPVAESELPEEGKPDLTFPHGFFSFNITGLPPGQEAIVTLTLPSDAPVGT